MTGRGHLSAENPVKHGSMDCFRGTSRSKLKLRSAIAGCMFRCDAKAIEMSLQVLAYKLQRVIKIGGAKELIAEMRA